MAAINAIDITSLLFQEGSAPSTPASTKWRLYFKSTGLFVIDDAGTEIGPLGAATTPAFVGARVRHSTTQTIGTASWTSLSFDTEDLDSDAFHSTVTNNSRLTVPTGKTGKYLYGGGVSMAANTTGQRALRVLKNGTTRIGAEMIVETTSDGGLATRLVVSGLAALSATDYIELQAWQDSGGNVNSENNAEYSPLFWMTLIGI